MIIVKSVGRDTIVLQNRSNFMKRSGSFKPRQLPLCKWCFLEMNKVKDFCSAECSSKAKEWHNVPNWQKLGTPTNKGFYNDDFDTEYPM